MINQINSTFDKSRVKTYSLPILTFSKSFLNPSASSPFQNWDKPIFPIASPSKSSQVHWYESLDIQIPHHHAKRTTKVVLHNSNRKEKEKKRKGTFIYKNVTPTWSSWAGSGSNEEERMHTRIPGSNQGQLEETRFSRVEERERESTAWTNSGRERTTRMTDRWSTKCAQRARASPLYTLELAPVLAQIGLLSFVHSAPWFPTGNHVLQSFHASVPPVSNPSFHAFGQACSIYTA